MQRLAQLEHLVCGEVWGKGDAFVDLLQGVHVAGKGRRGRARGGGGGWVARDVESV